MRRRLYTTYWGRRTPGPKTAICHTQPRGWSGRVLDGFKPPRSALNNEPGWEAEYQRRLDRDFPTRQSVLDYLPADEEIYLTCWEKDPAHCHRSTLARHLRRLGFDVAEYGEVAQADLLEGVQRDEKREALAEASGPAPESGTRERDLRRLREWIERQTWVYAKTMPWCPHWYCVREKEIGPPYFDEAVKTIRKYGYDRLYRGRVYRSLDLGSYYYWTMGAPVEETIIINRALREQT